MFAILYPVSPALVGGIPRLKLPLKLISSIKTGWFHQLSAESIIVVLKADGHILFYKPGSDLEVLFMNQDRSLWYLFACINIFTSFPRNKAKQKLKKIGRYKKSFFPCFFGITNTEKCKLPS